MVMLYIGRRIPKGFIELEGSIHLGHGIWIFRVGMIQKEDKKCS